MPSTFWPIRCGSAGCGLLPVRGWVKLGSNESSELAMHTLTVEDLARQPQRLLDDAERGEPSLVTRSGEPVLLAVPLAAGLDPHEVRQELAARLYDCGQISLGTAARIAGLAYTEMIDELGRRGIAVIRLEPGELERELAAFGP